MVNYSLKSCILIILTISILFILYKTPKELFISKDEILEICNSFYDDSKRKRKVFVIPNLFSPEQCEKIIHEGEEYAKKHSWLKKRHDDYPTTDNEITEKWLCYNFIYSQIYKHIIPEFSKQFSIDQKFIGINEIFIVKYSDNYQRKLDTHKDGSELSFIITLNKDFVGGGTYFTKLKRKFNPTIGWCTLFSGQESHKGLEITKGTRYILTGFLNVFKEDHCSDLLENK